jgi:hypothetical protein
MRLFVTLDNAHAVLEELPVAVDREHLCHGGYS